jgi:hypothetical protein
LEAGTTSHERSGLSLIRKPALGRYDRASL